MVVSLMLRMPLHESAVSSIRNTVLSPGTARDTLATGWQSLSVSLAFKTTKPAGGRLCFSTANLASPRLNGRRVLNATTDLQTSIVRRTPGLYLDGRTGCRNTVLNFFLQLKVNGMQVNNLFFDSGASQFPAILDEARWEAATGRNEAEATQRVQVPSWGKTVTMLGAPITGAVEVDSVRYEKPLVFFQKEKDSPSNFSNWPFPVGGSIGNALFFDEVIAIDLGAFPAFGIVR